MNAAHDMGGMHGFGPIVHETNEPVFHADWERRVFTVNLAMGYHGIATSDESRHAMERMGNVRYLSTSYYEHWLIGLETLLVEKGVISEEERLARIQALHEDSGTVALPHGEAPDDLSALFAELVRSGGSAARETGQSPRFGVGDVVRTRVCSPSGHTRLPRYARGKRGRIIAYHGAHVFPDTNAHGLGEHPQPLYTVRFDARELWGEDGNGGDVVHLDLWESYFMSDADQRP